MDSDILLKNLVKIKITHLIKFAGSFAGIEIHIPVGAKYIKLNYAEDTFVEILRKLKQKEVEDVYVYANDCTKILTHLQEAMSSKTFYDPKTVDESRIESMEDSMHVVRNIIGQMGVHKQSVELLKTINLRSISMISESPSIFNFVKRFRENCSEEFMMTVLTSYITSLVIDKFQWSTTQVKEKASLAAMLCDVTLDRDDFECIKACEASGGDLPEKIRKHPIAISELLRQKKELIPSETITIIEQHHELPDGKGYPHGITSSRFNQLSSTFIVCHAFVGHLFEHSFNYEKKSEIIAKVQKIYSCKSFDKSLEALVSVVSA